MNIINSVYFYFDISPKNVIYEAKKNTAQTKQTFYGTFSYFSCDKKVLLF